MTDNKVNIKSRKFISLILGVLWGSFFVGICASNTNLIQLSPFAIVIAGLFPAYMGSNVLREKFKK